MTDISRWNGRIDADFVLKFIAFSCSFFLCRRFYELFTSQFIIQKINEQILPRQFFTIDKLIFYIFHISGKHSKWKLFPRVKVMTVKDASNIWDMIYIFKTLNPQIFHFFIFFFVENLWIYFFLLIFCCCIKFISPSCGIMERWRNSFKMFWWELFLKTPHSIRFSKENSSLNFLTYPAPPFPFHIHFPHVNMENNKIYNRDIKYFMLKIFLVPFFKL